MSRHLSIERIPSGMHFNLNDNDDAMIVTLPHAPGQSSPAGRSPFLPHSAHSDRPSSLPSEPRVSLCLPLVKIATEVTVDGTVALTKLVQRFINRSEAEIHQARYTFPLYDGAVVTAFKCSVGDNMVLVGKVEPREDARATYKMAVEQRYAAALLEEHTPEVFETVVGNIPSMTEAEVEIKYVSEVKAALLDGRKEGLELVIPMSIAPRYGRPVGGDRHAEDFGSVEPKGSGLDILVKISNDGSIEGVEQSHNSNTKWNVPIEDEFVDSFGIPAGGKGKAVSTTKSTQIHVRHTSAKTIMDEDFVLTIENSPEHPLRSRAVLSPANSTGHAALLVNVKPGELFKDAAQAEKFGGEIILMLDQSDSMGWPTGTGTRTKIETLRRAMPSSLTSLPSGCAFNILSFGGTYKFLWNDGSKSCTESNREAAIKYGGSVQSNMGGTELLVALKAAVASRLADRSSTQIVIITDGEVEQDEVLEFVWKIRQELGHRIRFFALGIGTRVPHRLIGRIGEFGGGYGEVIDIDGHPQWSDRLTRILQAGIMPSSWEFDVDLGQGFERKDLVEYQLPDQERPSVQSDDVVPYVQAPYPTPGMHPFSYRSVFFLLQLGKHPPPSQVTLRSTTPGTKTQTAHALTVTPTWTDKAAILHLAVKAVLLGLEAQARGADWERAKKERVQRNAEWLGTLYAITSQWTSFVAVDPGRKLVSGVEFHKARLIEVAIGDVLHPPTPSSGASPSGIGADSPPSTGAVPLNDTMMGGFFHGIKEASTYDTDQKNMVVEIDSLIDSCNIGQASHSLGDCDRRTYHRETVVYAIAFSPDSRRLASVSDDHTIKIWDPATGRYLQILEGHRGSVGTIAFSPDSHLLASASDDYTVKIWDPATGRCLQTLEGYRGSVGTIAFSPDSHLLASVSDDHIVKIWDPATGRCLQTLEGHCGSIGTIAFSPDSHLLVSASEDHIVKIWDPATGRCLQILEGYRGSVGTITFSPDSRQLASVSDNHIVKIWDLATGRCLQTLQGHCGSISAIAFSPDSRRLVSVSDDHTVKIWDPVTGRCLQILEGHRSSIRAITFSPDSHLLASASDDYTIKIWDPVTGRYLQTLEGHCGSVGTIAFSPDSHLLASASDDHTVKIWDPATGRCLQTLDRSVWKSVWQLVGRLL